VCNYCIAERNHDTSTEKLKRKKEFEEYIETVRGRSNYDCLLLYSGGKDSTYMLYLLSEKYDLKVLTVTIDTGLHSHFAQENISAAEQYFHVEHLTVAPENNFYMRLYSYLLTHSSNQTYCENVCSFCSTVMHSIGLNVAVEKKIPFVAIGYSPDQEVRSNRYEVPPEVLTRSWVPPFLNQDPFIQGDQQYFWDPQKSTFIPRFFIPYHFLGYPGSNKILATLSEMGLGKRRTFHPFKSNCALFWLLMYLDLNKSNNNPYFEYVSKQIREGIELGNRDRWLLLMTLGTWLFKTGVIKTKEIMLARKYLDIENLSPLIHH
jgi:hypothetical protein